MGREFEIARKFSEDLDCLLKGVKGGPGSNTDTDYQTDLKFAEMLIRMRVNPAADFEARLQEKLLARFDQQAAKRISFWEKLDTALHRPVWRMVMPIMAVLLLITSIFYGAGILPEKLLPSPEVSAASIADHSPQVLASFGDEKILTTTVTQIVDQEGTVIMWSKTRTLVARVDLKDAVVTEVIKVNVPEFTPQDEQTAIDLVRADPRAQALFDQGAVIAKVNPGRSIVPYTTTDPDGQVHMQARVNITVEVRLKLGKSEWFALVDPGARRVFVVQPVGKNHGFNGIIDVFRVTVVPIIAAIGILILVGMVYYRRSRGWAGLFSILLGILAIPAVLYAPQYTFIKLAPVFCIPLVGVISGIIGVKTGHKRTGITGIVLSGLAITYLIFSIVIAILSDHGLWG